MASSLALKTVQYAGRRVIRPSSLAVTARWQSSTTTASVTNATKPNEVQDGTVTTPFPTSPPEESTTTANEAPVGLMQRSEKGFFARVFDKYSFSQQTNRILVAESLLQAATRQASNPLWFGPGRIGRDFRSYQALLTMHIWLLHKRLILDAEDPHRAGLIQEELFDIFWTDSSNRMRSHGVNELLINKNLKTVQQYTFMHLFHYDHCYTELIDNPKERLEELKNLVLTHVLLINPEDQKSLDEHDDHAERIAWYIETQYQNIVHDLPDSFYRKARIAWVDLPDFSSMKDSKGQILPDNPIDPQDILPPNWVKNIANDGTSYWWNEVTREAKWERPM